MTLNLGFFGTSNPLQGGQLQEYGPAQSEAAAVSASVYGSRTLQGLTSLQFELDSDALAVAQWYGNIYSFPIPRVQQMQLDSWAAGGNNIPKMLGLRLYDRVTVLYNGATPQAPFIQDSLVESITHNVDMDNGPTWNVQLALSPYEILLSPTILGTWQFGTAASVAVLTL